MRLSCGGHMHAHVHVHACVFISFLFWRWKHRRIYASLMCMTVSGFCLSTLMSMLDSRCQHAHARTHAEITRTPLSCGGDKCDADSLSLLIQSYIQTCILVCVCVCIYVFIFFGVFFWWHLTAGCLTLWSSSIQVASFVQQPVVGPATRLFSRAFIASVSVCVSRGCLQSAVLEWKCWMCVSECVYVWVYMTAVWPNIKCLLHMDSTSGMHTPVHVHACMLISFLYFRWKHSRIYAPLMCMTVSVFCLSTFMSMHDSCHHTHAPTRRDHSHTLELRWWRVWRWFALALHTIIHSNMHKLVCMCISWYIYIHIYLFECFSDQKWQLVV